MAPQKFSLLLVWPPPVFSKKSIKIQCFFTKVAQSFFDFVRVALFVLLNAIFIAFI